MNQALTWGGSQGWTPGAVPTSNSEYGRAMMTSVGDQNSTNPVNSFYVHGSPTFRRGNIQTASWPNYNYGGTATVSGQNYAGSGNYVKTGRGGVYGTGGNSSTDFEVLTGDAAAAVLDRSNYQHTYNFTPASNDANYGSDPGNSGDAPNQDGGGGGEGSGSTAYATINGRQIQGTNLPSGDQQAYSPNSPQQPQQASSTANMIPATGLRVYKPKPPRYLPVPSMPHVYSSVRPGKPGTEPSPTFALCGKCTKCKNLQSPGTGTPSNVNFKNLGRTPSGATRFALPKAVTSTPDFKQGSSASAQASKQKFQNTGRRTITPLNQTASLSNM